MNNEPTDERHEYLRHRERLFDSESTQSDTFDRFMLTLSAGTFGVTFSFMNQIARTPWVFYGFAIVGWIMFALSIITTLASFLVSQGAHRFEIEETDRLYREPRAKPRSNRWIRCTTVLNWASMIEFTLGIGMIIIFVALNLPVAE